MSPVRSLLFGITLAIALASGCGTSTPNSEVDPSRRSVAMADRSTPTGLLLRSLSVGEVTANYAIYVPRQYDASKAWPAIVFLHGRGECGTDGQKQIAVGMGSSILFHQDRWPAIVIFPQKPTQPSSWLDHERLVLATLDATMRDLNIDPDRVMLTGLSQGGCGTWEIAANNPHRFAAIAPICGYADAPNVPERVAHLPIWAFHGAKDDVVTPDRSQRIVDEVKRLQSDPARASAAEPIRFTLYPNANHNSWDAAYGDPELAMWLTSQQRKPH